MKVKVAEVWLWKHRVGAVALDDLGVGVFEYDPEFLKSGLDIAPLMMPLSEALRGHVLYSFPALNAETFKRLPGLLADTLPDKFGTAIVNAWLARQGRSPDDFSIIERLCYTGTRAMGALTFKPAVTEHLNQPVNVEISELITLIQDVMSHRNSLNTTLSENELITQEALLDILRIGTSAGGARAKAVIAYNEKTGKVLSGQADAPKGFEHWLLKFDGVSDIEFGRSSGFGRIEYAYYKMATAAGITMTQCRLLEENGRAHFMTQRFDRVAGDKLHMQSLCAIAHYDFNLAGAYGYEQALMTMRSLKLSKREQLQLYRRMVFNVIARNQDDHTKNIAFLMNSQGEWSLSPAYDMTHSYKPGEGWTQTHQMSINGKRDHFTRQDLIDVAQSNDLKNPEKVIADVIAAVEQWSTFAVDAGVDEQKITVIANDHRLDLV
ncbi:MAG: type II toxin-antitoxin system HipA family toxin [Proteobacteria bacterium]|nr:type II toxin-antitoxin system HipA family toxin [Pseudomonadota bacterium]